MFQAHFLPPGGSFTGFKVYRGVQSGRLFWALKNITRPLGLKHENEAIYHHEAQWNKQLATVYPCASPSSDGGIWCSELNVGGTYRRAARGTREEELSLPEYCTTSKLVAAVSLWGLSPSRQPKHVAESSIFLRDLINNMMTALGTIDVQVVFMVPLFGQVVAVATQRPVMYTTPNANSKSCRCCRRVCE
jgi:hypothetical protein